MNIQRIGIMGGTFDPIHYGHLVAAETVGYTYQLDQVIFVPIGTPPHKNQRQVSDAEHRYNMCLLATNSNPLFSVSDLEISREGVTYTVDTLKELKKRYQRTEFYFITGADAIEQIESWKEPGKLLRLCSFIGVTRPSFNKKQLESQISFLQEKYEAKKIHMVEVPALAISSSQIRESTKGKKSIKYLLPESVEQYIYKYKLYIE